jgi:hypothetical protein
MEISATRKQKQHKPNQQITSPSSHSVVTASRSDDDEEFDKREGATQKMEWRSDGLVQ